MTAALIERIERILTGTALLISIPLTVAIVAVGLTAIFYRYVLNQAIISSFDIMILMFSWTVFLGLVVGERDGSHLSLDITGFFASPSVERVLAALRYAVSAVICAYVAYAGYKLTARTGMEIPSMRISQKWLYAPLPIGFAALSIVYLLRVIRTSISTREAA